METNSDKHRKVETAPFDSLQRAMLDHVAKNYPDKLNHFHKAYRGSLRAAVTAKCLTCCDLTSEIRNCGATACPLHAQRPYQNTNPEKANAQGAAAEVKHEPTPL